MKHVPVMSGENGLELYEALNNMLVFFFSFRISMDLCVDWLFGSRIGYCFHYHSCFVVRQVGAEIFFSSCT